MKEFLKRVIKYVKRVILVSGITSIAVIIFSLFTRFKISTVFMYTSLIYMVIGGASFMGSLNTTTSINYIQAKSINSKSVYENAVEDYNSREESQAFYIFMGLTGFILFAIGSVLDALI